MVEISTKVVGREVVNAKLRAAAPNILAHNRSLVRAMLEETKRITEAQTPTGPGHFGYHLKNSYQIDWYSHGTETRGVMKAPMTGYWREFGTRGRFRKGKRKGGGSGGERAYRTAHKALAVTKKFINYYYDGMANWWKA